MEEQFYLVFPLILYVCLQQKNRPTQYKNLYYLLLPALAAMSFLWSIYQTNTAHEKAFYLLPSRFWELAAGALLYQIHSHPNGYLEKIKGWAAPVGATLLVIGFVFANKSQFPFPWAFVPVVATVLLLIAVTTPNQKSIFLSVFTASSLRYVGRLSYSLYLWHWPVFVLCRWTVGLESAYTICFAIALTLVLAVVSHHSIENHFRDHIVFKTQPAWKTVFSGGMAIAFASVVLGSVYYLSKPMGWSLSVTQNECVWQPYNSNCQPRTNATKTNRRLFITGDSHAGAYKLMAETAAARFGASVHIRSYAGNPLARLIDIEKDQRLYQRAYNETLAWIDRYAQPGDIVFLASLRIQRLGNQWGSFNPELVQQEALSATQNETIKASTKATTELIQALQKRHLLVLMDAPKPVFQAPPFRCADWFNQMNPVCRSGFTTDQAFLLKLREPTVKALDSLALEQGVAVWDPFPVLCPGSTCKAMDGEKPVFFDGDHLSGYGNQLLVEPFTRQLAILWGVEPGRQ